MNIDYLSQLPVDVFIKNITYLPFGDVVSVCSANQKLRSYCNDPKYNNNWKNLIDNTFSHIYGYHDYLNKIWKDRNYNEGIYNYLVYTQLVKLLDPATQLMIYYKQGDMDSFDSDNFNNKQRLLAMFLLGEKDLIKKYSTLKSHELIHLIDILNNRKISQNKLDNMLIEIIKEGNVKGL